MSTSPPESVPSPAAKPPSPLAAAPLPLAARSHRKLWIAAAATVAIVIAVYALVWIASRLSHSETDDAFVEAHIVNVAPEAVSGHIVRFLVEENDRVRQGQILAEIDPIPYQDKVELARSKVEEAEADLRRQETTLVRVKSEVPIQIEIAKRTLAAAQADEARAKESLRLTSDQVEKGILAGQAGVDLAQADLVLAAQEYERFTALYRREVVPLERSQQATRSRDAAQAQKNLAAAKLAQAEADRTEIDVSRRALEAADKSTQKAREGVNLAETANDQIKEAELLTVLKREMVKEARRGLTAAEDDLKYTVIRAPFPGVVVKRYRHLGDFTSAGIPLLSMYNPDLMYVTANLEETRLPGVAPGNPVTLYIDAFRQPFRGRVAWINKSTGAQFALMPRNVVSGEFTKVVQRVPVRIWIEKDDRWPQLQAGLSVCAVIGHGTGDPDWAEKTGREFADLEGRYNLPQPSRGQPGHPHGGSAEVRP